MTPHTIAIRVKFIEIFPRFAAKPNRLQDTAGERADVYGPKSRLATAFGLTSSEEKRGRDAAEQAASSDQPLADWDRRDVDGPGAQNPIAPVTVLACRR